jgi:hypothetical protein
LVSRAAIFVSQFCHRKPPKLSTREIIIINTLESGFGPKHQILLFFSSSKADGGFTVTNREDNDKVRNGEGKE